jgi:parallel beta-helix repeat protein
VPQAIELPMHMPGLASRWIIFVGSVVSIPATASAQNATTAGAFELYPTIHCIGARLSYSGDDNRSATARLEWRPQGSATWIRGVSLTRIANRRWAGSVLWLSPDTPYEVRAVVTDPDGGSANVAGVMRTRRNAPPAPTGTTWWVATNGSDSNPGNYGKAFATIQNAVDHARPGDLIRVRSGLYYQTVHPNAGGTASAWIHLVAETGAILDGSDPALMHRADWRDETGGVFSLPYTGTARMVCADSSQRLYHQATLADLRAGTNGVNQGFALENGLLYARLEDGSSPAGHEMHIARLDDGVFLEFPYWRVSGFEIRYFGTSVSGAGIYLRAASNCAISGNVVHAIGGRGIYLRVNAADNLIESNHCYDPRIGTWPWLAVELNEAQVSGISNRGGRGNVIRSNVVSGWFDGLDATNGQTDENVTADCDYYDNAIVDGRDDGIETDTISGINLRLWRNHIARCFDGISVAPNYQGPEYILYNTISSTDLGGFKFSLEDSGTTWICHNTIVQSLWDAPVVHPTGHYSNVHFRNNIMVGKNAAPVSDDAGESMSGNDFDGDLLYGNDPTLFRWKGTNYSTLAALQSATGFERAGRAGNPLFRAAAVLDFAPLVGSPAIDGAVRLEGINDSYAGLAPDIGAIEASSLLDVDHSSGATALALEDPSPNPIHREGVVAFSLPRPGFARLSIYDVSGRLVRTLAEGTLPAGRHAARWTADDASGSRVAAGVYFMRLSFEAGTVSKRVVLIP